MRYLSIVAMVLLLLPSAFASDFGCTVLLCLSNPASAGGPMGIAECRAPLNQLWEGLRRGRPLPTCDLTDGNDAAGNYVRIVSDPYDPCPEGLQVAPPSVYIATGQRSRSTVTPTLGNSIHLTSAVTFTSDTAALSKTRDPLTPRACVGRQIGEFSHSLYQGEGRTVRVYDQLVWQQPQSPRAIDVYTDGKLTQRVRW